MEDAVYQAIKKLLEKHVKTWKGVKRQEDGLGYIMNMIEDFVDDPSQAFTYAHEKED